VVVVAFACGQPRQMTSRQTCDGEVAAGDGLVCEVPGSVPPPVPVVGEDGCWDVPVDDEEDEEDEESVPDWEDEFAVV